MNRIEAAGDSGPGLGDSGSGRTRAGWAALLAMVAALSACESGQAVPPLTPVVTSAAAASQSAAAASAAAIVPKPPPAAPAMSRQALMQHVQHLASKKLNGRDAASEGERAAARYIIEHLDKHGVTKLNGVRQQAFPVEDAESANVWGLLPGSDDALKDSFVIVGAHYDHMGVMQGKLYPGAEDNATGVALVLELARALAAEPDALGRSVLVVFFGAEEMGMIGSKAFVDKPPLPLAAMHSMVNVDMIGRPLADQAALALPKLMMGIDSKRSVGVLGTDKRPVFRAIVDASCARHGIRAVAPEDLGPRLQRVVEKMSRGRGDSYRFEAVGVPAMFFSSGESDDYHQPTDTADRVDAEVLAARAKAIKDIVVGLSRAPADVTQPVPAPAPSGSTPTSSATPPSGSAPAPVPPADAKRPGG